jgi:hypothetical protein
MTEIGHELRCELELLVAMMPLWRRAEVASYRDFMATKRPQDFQEYLDARFRVLYMEEKIDFINRVLRNNPND